MHALRRLTALAMPLVAGALLAASAPSAKADFRLCNRTGNQTGVAIGYRNEKGWMTEGWWNLAANECKVLLKGPLIARYYYIYAVDYVLGGEWGGKAYMCTQEKEFTINGIQDCVARGFDRTGFFEIDTGKQTSWTTQLTQPQAQGAKPNEAKP